MAHIMSGYLRILLILYTLLRIPSVYGKVTPWCGVIDYALVGRNYTTINATKNQKLCYQACLKDSPRCKSANYRPEDQECDLNCASHFDVCVVGRLVEQPGSLYTFTESQMGCETQLDSTHAASCKRSASPCSNPQGSEWQLVFKGVAGTGAHLHDLWINKTWDSSLKHHYRNETLYNAWNFGQINIKRVKLSLYDQTEVKVEVVFNGVDSNILSWFAKERLVSSPWSDLTTTATTYYFSITGYKLYNRRFFISHQHGGCSIDSGWLVVVETDGGYCPSWEQSYSSYPVILYSTHNEVSFQDAKIAENLADYLTIHIDTE